MMLNLEIGLNLSLAFPETGVTYGYHSQYCEKLLIQNTLDSVFCTFLFLYIIVPKK